MSFDHPELDEHVRVTHIFDRATSLRAVRLRARRRRERRRCHHRIASTRADQRCRGKGSVESDGDLPLLVLNRAAQDGVSRRARQSILLATVLADQGNLRAASPSTPDERPVR